MIILIYLIVISDPWMVLYVQSCACAVTATHLVMGELARSMSKAKKSHGDHKEIEHGVENTLLSQKQPKKHKKSWSSSKKTTTIQTLRTSCLNGVNLFPIKIQLLVDLRTILLGLGWLLAVKR